MDCQSQETPVLTLVTENVREEINLKELGITCEDGSAVVSRDQMSITPADVKTVRNAELDAYQKKIPDIGCVVPDIEWIRPNYDWGSVYLTTNNSASGQRPTNASPIWVPTVKAMDKFFIDESTRRASEQIFDIYVFQEGKDKGSCVNFRAGPVFAVSTDQAATWFSLPQEGACVSKTDLVTAGAKMAEATYWGTLASDGMHAGPRCQEIFDAKGAKPVLQAVEIGVPLAAAAAANPSCPKVDIGLKFSLGVPFAVNYGPNSACESTLSVEAGPLKANFPLNKKK